MTPDLAAALGELDAATERLLATTSRVDGEQARAPSRLPGWSRGHLVTHLARNADGLGRLAGWAVSGVETAMYPSPETRRAEIEAGADREVEHLHDDLAAASTRLRTALEELRGPALDAELVLASGAEVAGWEIPLLRIREVEVHHVDLDLGYEVSDWSVPFCRRTLDQVAAGFASRPAMPVGRLVEAGSGRSWVVGPVDVVDVVLTGSAQALLGWLLGRSDGTGLALQGRTDLPPAPPWA